MMKKTVVISDNHIPYNDDHAEKLVLKFIKAFKPNTVVLNGDVMDCYSVSAFDKSPADYVALEDELTQCKDFLNRLRRVSSTSEIFYVEGNHEQRLQRYILRQAPALFGIVRIEELLELNKFNVKLVGGHKDNYVQIGNIYVGHFNKVSKHSAYTVKNIIGDKGVSVIQGHTHRIGMYAIRMLDRTLCGWEGGCLCSLSPSYVSKPNWQQAITIIEEVNGMEFVNVLPICEIGNYKCLYHAGTMYRVKM